MKKNILLFVLIILPLAIFSQDFSSSREYYFNYKSVKKLQTDVMGFYNYLDAKTGDYKYEKIGTDSVIIFNGFPVSFTGNSFEGGIFLNMDTDPEFEILYNVGLSVYALNFDGTNVPGWPVTVSSYSLEGAPAAGDIDGDGQEEIVVTNHGATSGGFIYAYKKNGTLVAGFPINHGYSSRTPVLADLNNDGKKEIIVNKRLYPVGEVWVYNGNGTVYPGWPKPIGHVPASSSAAGDIDNDGFPEIISESYNALYVWKANGDSIPGFPFFMPNSDVNSYSSPVLADVDGDTYREIIFGTHVLGGGGYVYILRRDGTILSNWPKYTNYWIYTPPSVGYIDTDNILDVAVGDQILSATPIDMLYAWNINGNSLSGFPVGPLNALNTQPIIADIDNDNINELIIDDNSTSSGKGQYLAFNHNGTPVTGFPILTEGTTFFNIPCLLDIDRNGIMDMVGAGRESSTSSVYIYLWNMQTPYAPSKITLPMYQYNIGHTGVYGTATIVNIQSNYSDIPEKYTLMQNYPNPFNSITNVKFKLKSGMPDFSINAGFAEIKVYDITGKLIKVLTSKKYEAGEHTVRFDASGLPSGVYFYRLTAGEYNAVKKMVLIR